MKVLGIYINIEVFYLLVKNMELNTNQLIMQFDAMKRLTTNIEWRRARDLQKLLWYSDWRNFLLVINKAKDSCNTAWNGEITISLKSTKWYNYDHEPREKSMILCYLVMLVI